MEKQQFFITSAKTKKVKDYKVCEVSYKKVSTRDSGKTSKTSINEAPDDPIHLDMIISLKAFLPHFMLLSERANLNDFQASYFKEKKFLKETSPYEVTGIHIKEHAEKQSVIMVGRQTLKNGRVISMTIPMVCFDPSEDEEEVYALHKELKSAVNGFLDEVEKYLEGKIANQDPDLFSQEDESKAGDLSDVITENEDAAENEDLNQPEAPEVADEAPKDALDEVIAAKKAKTTVKKLKKLS